MIRTRAKRGNFLLLLILGLSLALDLGIGGGGGRGQPQPPAPVQVQTPILPFAQVQPGMKGIGKTVVQGTEIEDFFVEVVDVIEGPSLLNSFILIRARGDAIERSGGIAQGMSGSPVYVDGKLMGAISMAAAWAVPEDALALVTPIESMLELWEPSAAALAAHRGPDGEVHLFEEDIPVRSHQGLVRMVRVVPEWPPLEERARHPKTLFARPLAGIILASGLRTRGFQLLAQGPRLEDVEALRPEVELPLPLSLMDVARFRLGDQGLTFLESGVAGTRWQATRDLRPGSALAVLLARGDVTLTSIGTVTLVEDGRLLAFGHPFLFKGPSQYFLTGAFIYTTFRTLEIPFKYGAPDAVVLGTITQDRAQGIAGVLGQEPEKVDLLIRVRDRDRGQEVAFRVELVEMADLLPSLVLSTVTNALDLALNRVSGGTVGAEYTVRLVADGLPLNVLRRDVFFDFQDVAPPPALQIAQVVANLALNPFRPVDLKEVAVTLTFTEVPRVAEIVGLETDKEVYRPGETVHFRVVLRPFRGPEFTQEGEVPLPEDLEEGERILRAVGGRRLDEEPEITSVEELVQTISGTDSNGQITLELADREVMLPLESWFVKGNASKEIEIQAEGGESEGN